MQFDTTCIPTGILSFRVGCHWFSRGCQFHLLLSTLPIRHFLFNTLPIPAHKIKLKKKNHYKLNKIQQTYTKKQQTNIGTKKTTTTWKFVESCVLIKVFKQKLYIEEVELSLNAEWSSQKINTDAASNIGLIVSFLLKQNVWPSSRCFDRTDFRTIICSWHRYRGLLIVYVRALIN